MSDNKIVGKVLGGTEKNHTMEWINPEIKGLINNIKGKVLPGMFGPAESIEPVGHNETEPGINVKPIDHDGSTTLDPDRSVVISKEAFEAYETYRRLIDSHAPSVAVEAYHKHMMDEHFADMPFEDLHLAFDVMGDAVSAGVEPTEFDLRDIRKYHEAYESTYDTIKSGSAQQDFLDQIRSEYLGAFGEDAAKIGRLIEDGSINVEPVPVAESPVIPIHNDKPEQDVPGHDIGHGINRPISYEREGDLMISKEAWEAYSKYQELPSAMPSSEKQKYFELNVLSKFPPEVAEMSPEDRRELFNTMDMIEDLGVEPCDFNASAVGRAFKYMEDHPDADNDREYIRNVLAPIAGEFGLENSEKIIDTAEFDIAVDGEFNGDMRFFKTTFADKIRDIRERINNGELPRPSVDLPDIGHSLKPTDYDPMIAPEPTPEPILPSIAPVIKRGTEFESLLSANDNDSIDIDITE